jgi:16S rRNA (guanine527-N7)-methyltransferase
MYIDLLLRWNTRINLTAVREPEEIVTRHFGESIFVARHLLPRANPGADASGPGPGATVTAPHVIDVGSGAGFPGLPLKIWAPHACVTLIESNQKKATFLREVVRKLELGEVETFMGRADTFAGLKGDVVTIRAVERFESILPVAAGLLEAHGRLALLVGGAQLDGVRRLATGLQWDQPVRLPLSSNRVVIIGRKESQLPT